MEVTLKRKQELIKKINWDYNVSVSEILEIIEGKKEKVGSFTKVNLFARSYQGLKWHSILELWGYENIKQLLSEKNADVRKSIIPALRSEYDFVYSVLFGKTLPSSRFNSSNYEWNKHAVLSDRWNRTIKGIS